MISRTICAKPLGAPQPARKVHGAAVLIVQVAMPSVPHRSPKVTSNDSIRLD